MSAEEPYLRTLGIHNQDLLHIPVIEQFAEARDLLAKIGLRRQVAMNREGRTAFDDGKGNEVRYTTWEVVKTTPYTEALNRIGTDEKAGDIPEGSYGCVLDLMLSGTFEDSGWAAKYMPRQSDR